MPLKSIRSKISNLASGEILGETTEEERKKELEKKKEKEKKVKPSSKKRKSSSTKSRPAKINKAERPKKESNKREPKERKHSKERSVTKEGLFNRRSSNEAEKDVELQENPTVDKKAEKVHVKEAIDGYEDVLSILNIKENIDIDSDFESKDLDYIQFSQTTPLGFDFDEVTDFISRMKYTLSKYESAIKQRDRELIIVASEVKKIEKKMVEQLQNKELERITDGMSEKESLIDENVDLKIEVNRLKMELINKGKSSNDVERLENEIKILRAENEMLIRKDIQSSTHESSADSFKLPNADNDMSLPSTDLKLPSSELVNDNSNKRKPLPAFNTPTEVEVPTYDEEDDDDFLANLMRDRESASNLDSMMEDMGDDYNEK